MRLRSALIATCALALGLAACSSDTGTVVVTNASVRFVNAMSDVPALTIAANGTTQVQNLAFQGSTATCSALLPVATNFSFTQAGTPTSLGSVSQNLTAAGNYTVVASGTAAAPQFMVLNNAITTTTGNGAVRVINAVQGSNPVDVFVTAPNAPLGTASQTGLVFGSGSSFISVPAGQAQVALTSSGSITPIFTSSAFTVTAGSNQTFFVAPGTGGVQFSQFIVNGC